MKDWNEKEKFESLTSNVSTKSFRGLSLRSGSLKRMEQAPPLPSNGAIKPAHLDKEVKKVLIEYLQISNIVTTLRV